MLTLKDFDPEIAECIKREEIRQEENIELIASENATLESVLEATGSCLTNKYAEGYPGKRYYGGCEVVDEAESLAIERAKSLFKAEAVNVQPHSGSQANMAVYMAELSPGDKILGMNLSEGGHLTHGSPVNFSGKLYEAHFYGVDHETGQIDYDLLQKRANEVKPKMIVAGASAYPRLIDFSKFRKIADACGAVLMVDMAHIAGLVAAGVHPSPIPYADYVTTTTHKTLRGPRGGLILTDAKRIKKINSSIFPGIQGGPLMHVIAAKAVCFKAAHTENFKIYAQKTVENSHQLAETLKERGFKLISGGTDNHLILIDLRNKQKTGKALENALDNAGITLNKNTVPGDPESPFVTSGVRIGTPTVTTRGMGVKEMTQISQWISDVTDNMENKATLKEIKNQVSLLCKKFPLYGF